MLNPEMITGMPVIVGEYMIGTTKAVMLLKSLYVSHELFDLIRKADPDELKKILESVDVIDLDALRSSFDMVATKLESPEYKPLDTGWKWKL